MTLTWEELAAIGAAWRAKMAAEMATPEFRAAQAERERRFAEAREEVNRICWARAHTGARITPT